MQAQEIGIRGLEAQLLQAQDHIVKSTLAMMENKATTFDKAIQVVTLVCMQTGFKYNWLERGIEMVAWHHLFLIKVSMALSKWCLLPKTLKPRTALWDAGGVAGWLHCWFPRTHVCRSWRWSQRTATRQCGLTTSTCCQLCCWPIPRRKKWDWSAWWSWRAPSGTLPLPLQARWHNFRSVLHALLLSARLLPCRAVHEHF